MPISRPLLIVVFLALLATLVPVARLHAQATPARGPTSATGGDSTAATRPTATTSAPAARGGGRGIGAFGTPLPQTPPVPGNGPTCTLDATIYDVRVPADQIGRLDLEALTRAAATAAAFEKALAEMGTVKPLYQIDQSVRLTGDTIVIGTQIPYITNSQITNTGQTINSVSYTQVGALFNIAGKAGAGGNIELDLGIQVSANSESGVPISTKVNAPIFRTVTMARKGPVEARVPFVVVSVDAANGDAAGKAVAYIARVTLGAPQSAVGPARGE